MSAGYGAILKKKLLGKNVEIYQGDAHQTLKGYADYDTSDKSVLYGKLVDVEETCITLQVQGTNGNSALVYVNTWSVYAVTVPGDGVGIADAYWPSTVITHDQKSGK